MSNYLGLDIGTSNIKAVLYDTEKSQIISSASRSTPTQFPQNGYIEHDPDLLWKNIAECTRATIAGYHVDGMSISSLAEAGLPLDRKMNPLYPIIAWYDTRSQVQVDRFLQKISEEEIFQITGQKPGFSFGVFKYLWIMDNIKNITKRFAFWMSVPDYILYKLTGEKYTDYTQASRTLLFDQKKKDWSTYLTNLAGINPNSLPVPKPSGTIIGEINKTASFETGLPLHMPCTVGGHDHLCGAFASGGINTEKIIDSSGTSQAVMAFLGSFHPSPKILENGFVNYIHVIPDIYIIKGGLKAAGKAIEWLSEIMNSTSIPDLNTFRNDIKNKKLNHPVWLPFFHGSGTPNSNPFDQAALIGVNLQHTNREIMTALFEGLGFWLRENVDTLVELTGHSPDSLIAIGGTNQNQLLLFIKACALNLPIISPKIPEPCALGAALLAAIGCGTYKDSQEAYNALSYPTQTIYPDEQLASLYSEIYLSIYLPIKNALIDINANLDKIYKLY